ncbi:ABC transporter permease [Penaeicola halotolerans]|uniref:ABC transporter permease n=1 Tax=Penaeicola halotolerans TaxID=2793196 RepID=UPI001CF88DBF|nr:FtsX-like permease family protein [Penaeicola halotolerans]
MKWILMMAWRDSRKNKTRLALFISSIVLGIAALVAINSFGDNLSKDINNQSKELIGADLVVESRDVLENGPADSLASAISTEASTTSMIFFPKNEDSRIMQVRALSGDFPYYGDFETDPVTASRTFRDGTKKALVDELTMIQYELEPGDSVRVGGVFFKIEGKLISTPGQTGIAGLALPSMFIPEKYLEETNLVQFGSRVEYKNYYKIDDQKVLDKWVEDNRDTLRSQRIRLETVESSQERTGRNFEALGEFLSLIAFIALLLGCVGVASSVHVYVKEKLATVAILRCLGVSAKEAFLIYLVQILTMGLLGSILGAALGSLIQFALPSLFQDFLPVEVSVSLSWSAIAQGIITGVLVAFLFAMLPLLKIRNTSPMYTLRSSDESTAFIKDPLRWLVFAGIVLFVWGFTYQQLGEVVPAIFFTLFLGVSFSLLFGVARLTMWSVRKFLPISWNYLSRQALANLYRPNNQTVILIATIGLGTAMISTLFFIQSLLVGQLEIKGENDQPNLLIFDIQPAQLADVTDIVQSEGLPIMQSVPIVTVDVKKVNGMTKEEIEASDSTDLGTGAFRREYRVTYRDSLISSETLLSGKLRPVTSPTDSIFVSLDSDFAMRNNMPIGTEMTFDVQGREFTAYVGSTRRVDFLKSAQTNFLILFPSGVLESAPQFHVIITRSETDREAAQVQRKVVRTYPNISIINLGTIISTLKNILDKITFVIQFMALFSILTGILVLIGSLIISKYQRMRESILLRTLGGSRNQITTINVLEYFFLGSLASLSGIILSLIATWLLGKFTFEMQFTPALLPVLYLYLIITSITVILGMLNGRGVLNRPPLEVLRSE